MVSILEVKKTIEIPLLENEDLMGIGLTPDWSTIILYIRDENAAKNYPLKIADFPVQLLVIGSISPSGPEVPDRKGWFRPLVGGISTGLLEDATGTLGAIVVDKETGEPLLMSNNHVFAGMSTESQANAKPGDTIVQPGFIDGGGVSDAVGTLAHYVPWRENNLPNLVDVALVSPDVDLLPAVSGDTGPVPVLGYAPLTKGERVWKVGRTSGYSEGVVTDIDFTVDVTVGQNPDGSSRYVRFTDQILIEIIALPGDSGSLILDMKNRAVGLLFAGGTKPDGTPFAVANKIRNVLAMADVDLPVTVSPAAISAPIIAAIAAGTIVSGILLYLIQKKK